MDVETTSSTEKVFATAEILEYILTILLAQLVHPPDREDPRPAAVRQNAQCLKHLLHCSAVNRTWNTTLLGSNRLQRALYLLPDHQIMRSWDSPAGKSDGCLVESYRAPRLNPIIQTTFPTYYLRLWHLDPKYTNNKHCAYLIITPRDLPALAPSLHPNRGLTISRMLLSQPPCTALEATIWEERDETRDYVERTRVLEDAIVSCEEGITVGLVQQRAREMFGRHSDVAAIKFTTL